MFYEAAGYIMNLRFLINRIKHFPNRHIQVPFCSTKKDGPLLTYNSRVKQGLIIEDKFQLNAIKELQALYDRLVSHPEKKTATKFSTPQSNRWLDNFFLTKKNEIKIEFFDSVQGVYMWGGVGCGKTYIMDIFYDDLPIKMKRRVHFNSFMLDVHKRLHQIKLSSSQKATYLMSVLVDDLMELGHVICFDEFQVTDIADAVILKTLFSAMFERGIHLEFHLILVMLPYR